MIRKKIIEKMVSNYYAQVHIVTSRGGKVDLTLREYLEWIKEQSEIMTDEEVEFGVSLERDDV